MEPWILEAPGDSRQRAPILPRSVAQRMLTIHTHFQVALFFLSSFRGYALFSSSVLLTYVPLY